ncbi:chondroitin sulfate synthase 2-like [Carcharodon carcharias]|uniref:chondroitin sulfate synthase 2-like n=1 Tax=Carcharodon carcharias TaxID=13397 RepID=UPI001B7F15F0|nr:chondroitin sulfate synthase 2-like [Carcharodon carcharias]
MRLSMLLALVRPVGPVVIGVSLGFTLSLLSSGWGEEPCSQPREGAGIRGRKPSSVAAAPGGESESKWQEFEPRIVPYKAASVKNPGKKTVRSRYISTELGIREGLFVAVLTSKTTLNTLAVAVNRTIGHHIDKVLYFTGTRSRKIPHGMYIVTHGDERPIWNMYQTVKYIFEHYSGEYDWFYFIQDNSYTESDRIKGLVNHLSINTDLYMGRPEEFIGGDTEGHYCHGGFGYLLSRSLMIKLQPHLESCRNDILSARPDEWLGRCIIDYVSVSCVSQYEGLHYRYFELLKNAELEKEEGSEFRNALTVHPVMDPVQMYRLHKRYTELELERTYLDIEELQDEIRNVSGLTAEGEKASSWPIGINPPFQPRTRFEVLRWDYFTEDQVFSCVDGSPKCELRGIDKSDISNIIEVAVEELNKKYQPTLHLRKEQLLNGYRRFDPTRGMEYTLDLQLEAVTQKGHSRSITKRVHLVRPLSNVEIIPMPYVTEATRIHIILPLSVHEREQAIRFIELYALNALESNENAILTLLFIYDPFEAQRVNQNDIFSSVKAKIMDCERKYPETKIPWISVKTDSPCQLKIMDIISKKHPVDTLFFVAGINMEVNFEFLNRCRMNTISQWQVFFPIHFQEYNPKIAYHNQPLPLTIDLLKDSGHFDRDFFDAACFYNSDYMAARGKMASDALENEEILETLDLYEMFVQYSNLHVFRAVEPALRQKHGQRVCSPRVSEEIYHRCVQSNLQALGSRSQLAMLLFEQEQGNST